MKRAYRPLTIILSLVAAALIVVGGVLFILSVRTSLWTKSVTDVLEVTAQGRHALDTYLEKDLETIHILADELADSAGTYAVAIQNKINFPHEDDTTYLCVELASQTVYTNFTSIGNPVGEEDLAFLAGLVGSGIREPFFDGYTGVRKIAVYERFVFADGSPGFVQKTQTLESVSERFSLSFYDNSGFSYVVNRTGDVLMRSLHRNSNRTFQNLFDIIDAQGNDEAVVQSFREALAADKRGVASFRYDGEDYAFCYVPMEAPEDWFVVSIIPNAVIMAQANNIIHRTLILCALILVCLIAVGLSFFVQMRRHHRETEGLAYYDTLTGLFRYEKLLMDGETLFVREEPLSVLYLDIVNFKLINDLEGYDYGDELLRRTAAILRRCAAAGDVLCRVSGDDFILLSNAPDSESLLALCRAILAACAEPDDKGGACRVRLGVCRREDAGEADHVSGLIDRARMAQRRVAEDGDPLCFYNEDMRADLLRDAEMERDMHAALRDGEFLYYIQAKYSPDGAKVLGGEALVRWQRANGSLVSPGDFIPLFERNGFIRELDEFVFRCVCRDLRRRLDEGLPVVPISVNVSRATLLSERFAAVYEGIKEENRLPDDLLELELTESLMLEDTETVFAILGRLREKGFRCSIDDFGSGYSSLNALKDLPADVLKLDRKFLGESVDLSKSETIVRFVIEMAKQLSMHTVAEGVETPRQLAFLRETGCDMIQGFIFSRPAPPEAFYEKL